MSDRMSDKMLDRMPENLSVRKYINIMVGITRNQIIFLIIILNNILIIFDSHLLGEGFYQNYSPPRLAVLLLLLLVLVLVLLLLQFFLDYIYINFHLYYFYFPPVR